MCKTSNGKYKISLSESVTSGSDGKTSATGALGLILCVVSIVMLSVLFVYFFISPESASNILEFADKVLVVMSLGSTLLGLRKVVGMIGSNKGAKLVSAVEAVLDEQNKTK